MAQGTKQSGSTERAKVIERLIANQRQAIRYYTVFAVVLFLMGITIIIVTYSFSPRLIADSFKDLLGIGGGFVSSLSAFPYKEVINRKERIGVLEVAKSWFLSLEETSEPGDNSVNERIFESLMKVVEKTISEKF